MIGCFVKHYENKIVVTVKKNDELIRKVTLIIGKEYIVNPVNKRKLKNRGRKVIFKGYENNKGQFNAKVQYLDTKRPGVVEIDDLDNVE